MRKPAVITPLSFGAQPHWCHICAAPEIRAAAARFHLNHSPRSAQRFELYARYHDEEWGRACHDERRLFELLLLEGMQAGLSWLTVLEKRPALAHALCAFDAQRLARLGENDLERLLANPAIIRNRRKLTAAIDNARAYLRLREQGRTLHALLWESVGGRPLINHWRCHEEIPATTPLAEKLSRRLQQLGFRFVGATIVYSLMQAAGMVNDHLLACPHHPSQAGNQEA
ncbi:MAG: DNA-3-methyladenine glycosylase I [Rhodocyclaceae bacterium]|nr:DNA-3-methyladenine glycosylase I [Rhodocyclaceae bacterium]